ncbi:hypothetical protein PIB30_014645 [Stylosanthes scabra]|uniref:Uncharacterized protein n=1 Tax=Stylosanthes scabra TaxID=79078 RepID=A0ABU6S841_9FABA|nr:hypothetical protein [Stylosanthes scabra]
MRRRQPKLGAKLRKRRRWKSFGEDIDDLLRGWDCKLDELPIGCRRKRWVGWRMVVAVQRGDSKSIESQ